MIREVEPTKKDLRAIGLEVHATSWVDQLIYWQGATATEGAMTGETDGVNGHGSNDII